MHNEHLPKIIISNDPYLASSERINFPHTLEYADHNDMDVLTLEASSSNYHVEDIAEEINMILEGRLISSGAILFRNLASVLPDSTAFSKLISHLGERMPYVAGTATRSELENSPGVMNAGDDPEECTLEPHLEMSYQQIMPSK